MTLLYIVLTIVILIALSALVSQKARDAIRAIWIKWFRESHVMAVADATTLAGLGLLADPDMMTLLSSVFHDWPWLVPALGVGLRLVRRLNDPEMKIGG
jgi:hypothetical protein